MSTAKNADRLVAGRDTTAAENLLGDEFWVRCLRQKSLHHIPRELCTIELVAVERKCGPFEWLPPFAIHWRYLCTLDTADNASGITIEGSHFELRTFLWPLQPVRVQEFLDERILKHWKDETHLAHKLKERWSCKGRFVGHLLLPGHKVGEPPREKWIDRDDKKLVFHYGQLAAIMSAEIQQRSQKPLVTPTVRSELWDRREAETYAITFLEDRFKEFALSVLNWI